MSEVDRVVYQCTVLEYDGENDYGVHDFLVVPRRGDTLELWRTDTEDRLFRVVEVRHVEFDENDGGDTVLYVERYDKSTAG